MEFYARLNGAGVPGGAQMEDQINNSESCNPLVVKAMLQLGSETFSVEANKGTLSEQLSAMKEQSMNIFKDYITKHNVPNEVPDDPEPISSDYDDEDDISQKPPKSKKRK